MDAYKSQWTREKKGSNHNKEAATKKRRRMRRQILIENEKRFLNEHGRNARTAREENKEHPVKSYQIKPLMRSMKKKAKNGMKKSSDRRMHSLII